MQVVVYNFESTPVAGVDAKGFGCVDDDNDEVSAALKRGWLDKREPPESLDGLNDSARQAFQQLRDSQNTTDEGSVKATRGSSKRQRAGDEAVNASESDQDSAQASGDNKTEEG